MSPRIEKTVFISYRRTNLPWALAIFQNLKSEGYDVFFDYVSIPSGDFEKIIIENIKSRAHFIVILTPSSLERCNEPGDWLRREIETAMDERRNIVPLMLESFDFGSPSTVNALTGKLENLKKYNGLRVHSEYFFEGMNRLREQFLNISLDGVIHPVSDGTTLVTEKYQIAASKVLLVEKEELTAQEWFERGYVFGKAGNFDEAIRCSSEAIHLKPDFAEAYYNRGTSYHHKRSLERAIGDYTEAIRLKPDYGDAYNNLAKAHADKGDLDNAITEYDQAIRLNPNSSSSYYGRGKAKFSKNDLDGASNDFNESIRINPNHALSYHGRAIIKLTKSDLQGAIEDSTQALTLNPSDVEPYATRAAAWYKKANYQASLLDYERYVELNGSGKKDVENIIPKIKAKI